MDIKNVSFDDNNVKKIPHPEEYEILTMYSGHVNNIGKSAGQQLNFAYLVRDKMESVYVLMFCKRDYFTKIDKEDYDAKIKDTDKTWYVNKAGYVVAHFGTNRLLYLHQLITGHYGNKETGLSVDHINRDKLDNRTQNLRITTASVQNANMDKKKRQKSAQQLPEGILQSDLPKYVTYNSEFYNTASGKKFREFFRVEGHPNNPKTFSTTKSMKISVIDKLREAVEIVTKLENQEVDL